MVILSAGIRERLGGHFVREVRYGQHGRQRVNGNRPGQTFGVGVQNGQRAVRNDGVETFRRVDERAQVSQEAKVAGFFFLIWGGGCFAFKYDSWPVGESRRSYGEKNPRIIDRGPPHMFVGADIYGVHSPRRYLLIRSTGPRLAGAN